MRNKKNKNKGTDKKKILMPLLAIALFVVVAMLLYAIRKERGAQDVPAQERPAVDSEAVEREILESLSAPARSEEDELKNAEEDREILESLSVPEDSDRSADEEVLKSLEALVK